MGLKMANYFNIMKPASIEWNSRFVLWVHKKFFKTLGKLIDLGCGNGEVVEEFKKLGYDAIGYDFPKVNLEKELKFKSNAYDYVVCKFVFEHISNINLLMQEIYRILKQDGKLIVLTDDATADFSAFLSDPTHITPFTVERLKNLALLNDFNIVYLKKWRNIPFLWNYTLKSFDYRFPGSKQIIGVFTK
jgi:ubiquinone/menaquinone biosynthesis C-methylase UbiE